MVLPDLGAEAKGDERQQSVGYRWRSRSVAAYFQSFPGVPQTLDHGRLRHPEQTTSVEHRQSAHTVGRLIHHTQVESLVQVIQEVLADSDPPARLQQLAQALRELYPSSASSKHRVGRDLGRLESTPSLRCRATG